MTEPMSKKPRLDDTPEVKYTKIFINNEWVDSGKTRLLWIFIASDILLISCLLIVFITKHKYCSGQVETLAFLHESQNCVDYFSVYVVQTVAEVCMK